MNDFSLFVILVVVNFLNFIDRGAIPGAPNEFNAFIAEDLNTDAPDAYFGLLQSAFIIGLLVGLFAIGQLIHYYSRFYITGWGMVIWLVAVIMCGLSRSTGSYPFLLFGRVLSGMGEASLQATVPPWIQDNAPASYRATWLAVFTAAMPVGGALGIALSSVIANSAGWQYTYFLVALGAAPFVAGIFWAAPQYPLQKALISGAQRSNDEGTYDGTSPSPSTPTKPKYRKDLHVAQEPLLSPINSDSNGSSNNRAENSYTITGARGNRTNSNINEYEDDMDRDIGLTNPIHSGRAYSAVEDSSSDVETPLSSRASEWSVRDPEVGALISAGKMSGGLSETLDKQQRQRQQQQVQVRDMDVKGAMQATDRAPTAAEEFSAVIQRPIFMLIALGHAANTASTIGLTTFFTQLVIALGYFNSEVEAATIFGGIIVIVGILFAPIGGIILDRGIATCKDQKERDDDAADQERERESRTKEEREDRSANRGHRVGGVREKSNSVHGGGESGECGGILGRLERLSNEGAITPFAERVPRPPHSLSSVASGHSELSAQGVAQGVAQGGAAVGVGMKTAGEKEEDTAVAVPSSEPYSINRPVLRTIFRQLIFYSVTGFSMFTAGYFLLDRTLWILSVAVGASFNVMMTTGFYFGMLTSVPPLHRSFAIAMYTFILHAFGDVPSPVIVGLVKDSLAPACTVASDDATDDDALTSDACRDQQGGTRLTFLLINMWLLWQPIVFSLGLLLLRNHHHHRTPEAPKEGDFLCFPFSLFVDDDGTLHSTAAAAPPPAGPLEGVVRGSELGRREGVPPGRYLLVREQEDADDD